MRKVTFENVTFSYPNSKTEVLKNAAITIPGGSRIGIVGPSGVGKTTVFELLMRFARPNEGRILIDGQDINTVTHDS